LIDYKDSRIILIAQINSEEQMKLAGYLNTIPKNTMATNDTVTGTTSPTTKVQHKEGPVAKAIEKQTAKLPSDTFLWIAVGAMAASAILQFTRKKHWSLFVGEWAAPLLIMGLYNTLVKVEGHDQLEHA
jgi:hypothetical protein